MKLGFVFDSSSGISFDYLLDSDVQLVFLRTNIN